MSKNPKKWAFLVGVSKYIYSFPNLDFATKHVNNIKRILKSSGEFEEPIVILTEESDKQHQPSKTNIMVQYSKLLKKIKPYDLLFAYFLSHGGLFPPWEQKKCMFPRESSKQSGPILNAASIPLSYFYEHEISKYPYQTWKVFFFFDICQCYTDIQSMANDVMDLQKSKKLDDDIGIDAMKIKEEPSDISQFYACSSSEKAFVFKNEEGVYNSVFSYALEKALDGGVEGPLTYENIVKYVNEEVINIRETYDNVPSQQPISRSNEKGNKVEIIGDKPPFTIERGVRDVDILVDEVNSIVSVIINNETENKKEGILKIDDDLIKHINANVEQLHMGDTHSPEFLKISIGKFLYDILFTGKLQEIFEKELEDIRGVDKFLRIKLKFEAKSRKLRELPWEYLYCKSKEIFLAADKHILFSRYFPKKSLLKKHKKPLQILLVAPEELEIINNINSKLLGLKKNIIVETISPKPTVFKLTKEIKKKYTFIFFLGYARYDKINKSEIALFTQEGDQLHWISAKELVGYFSKEERILLPHLIILPKLGGDPDVNDSVFQKSTQFARNFLEQGFPSIITFQNPYSESKAQKFLQEFFKQIAEENRINTAVLAGRFKIIKKKIKEEGILNSDRDYGTPVFFTQIYDNIFEKKSVLPEKKPADTGIPSHEGDQPEVEQKLDGDKRIPELKPKSKIDQFTHETMPLGGSESKMANEIENMKNKIESIEKEIENNWIKIEQLHEKQDREEITKDRCDKRLRLYEKQIDDRVITRDEFKEKLSKLSKSQ